MDFRYLALFLLMASLAYADCIGYTDSFDVRVLDAKYRPLPNATVTVTYDRGATFGEQYFTTAPLRTDASGIVHFTIYNQGTLTRTIDCRITVNGSAEGIKGSATVMANEHGSIVDVTLSDAYTVTFYVRDQLGHPLQNASVTVANRTEKTDADGSFVFYLRAGTYNYLASYLDAKQPGSLDVSNDTAYEIRLAFYNVVMNVIDEAGTPLPAKLTIFNRTFDLAGGHFEYDRVFGDYVPYSVDYKGIISNGTLTPASDPDVEIVYDLHSPVFGTIKPETFNEKQRLQINVSDEGKFASGLNLSSIKVNYKIEPADENVAWNEAVVFTAGRNQFTAEFPRLPTGRIVRFKIEVKDRAGNFAEIDGKFSTYVAKPPQNATNATNNQTNTQSTTQGEQGIPLSYIVGGAIVAVLVISLVFRIKSKTT